MTEYFLSGDIGIIETKSVYLNNRARWPLSEPGYMIGHVVPLRMFAHDVVWEARLMDGSFHGNTWLQPYYAAQALVNVYESCEAAKLKIKTRMGLV